MQTLNHGEQEKWKACSRLLEVLSEKSKPLHNETTLSLQYSQSVEKKKNANELIDCLRLNANECKYKERGRRLEEHFINRINDDDMLTEIIKELSVIKKKLMI